MTSSTETIYVAWLQKLTGFRQNNGSRHDDDAGSDSSLIIASLEAEKSPM